MALKDQETLDAEQSARLAILKTITALAGRSTSGSTIQQLAVAYKNVVAPHLAEVEEYDVADTLG
jgi:hypothetical protein